MADSISKLAAPAFDLREPGTFIFTGPASSRGLILNRFALSLRDPVARREFMNDEAAYLGRFELSDDLKSLALQRDWTGMLRAGGHVQAILKLAATVGQSLFDMGAHNAGVTTDTLLANCPRRVSGLDGLDG